jgi:hypothetical protein
VLGEQPGEITIQQSLDRVTYDPATRRVSVSLRDGSRFVYAVPTRYGQASSKARRIPAVTRAMALAISYQQLAQERHIRGYKELVKLSRISRPRLSQILMLTNLAPVIQEELLFLPHTVSSPERITEKQLRSIATRIDWREQIALFRSLWDGSGASKKYLGATSAAVRLTAVSRSISSSGDTRAHPRAQTSALSGPVSTDCAR